MKGKVLSLFIGVILILGLTGCGANDTGMGNATSNNDLLGSWSGESTNNQMCTLTFTEEKFTSECTGVFNKTYDFSGTYKVDGNTVTITSDDTGKETKYEYEIKEPEGLLKKRLSLNAIDNSVSYIEFDFEE